MTEETLEARLDAFREEWQRKAPAARRLAFERHIESLRAEGAEARALKPGDALPDLTLPDVRGGELRLRGALPAVIVFYRGGWCPYCNLELRYWQTKLPEIAAAGGTLMAISPEDPDNSLATAEKNGLAFPVLSDTDGAAARAFGLEFELPPELQALYAEVGHALPEIGAGTGWRLPVPGTFVVGRDGRVALAHADADYRKRLEPAAALAALRGLLPTGAAA
jgi:peroxiredoxin